MSLINDMLKELEARRATSEPLAYAGAQGGTIDAGQAAVLAGLSGVDDYRQENLSAARWWMGAAVLGAIAVVGLTMSQRVNQVGLGTVLVPQTPWAVSSSPAPAPANAAKPVARSQDVAMPSPAAPSSRPPPVERPIPPGNSSSPPRESRQVATASQLVADPRRYSLTLSSNLSTWNAPPRHAQASTEDRYQGVDLPADLQEEASNINRQFNAALARGQGPVNRASERSGKSRATLEPVSSPKAQPRPRAENKAGLGVVSSAPHGDESSVEVSKRELGSQQYIAADGLFREALKFVSVGDLTKASTLLEQAVAQDPTHERARESLAGIMVKRGQYEPALGIVREGLVEVPDSARLLFVQVRLLIELERYERALNVLNGMPRGTVHEPSRLAYSGAVLLRMGRPAEAAQAYKRAVMAAPDEGRWWLGLGVALEANGAEQQAAAAFERAGLNRNLGADARRYAATRAAALQARQ